jgi:hypothetical protein
VATGVGLAAFGETNIGDSILIGSAPLLAVDIAGMHIFPSRLITANHNNERTTEPKQIDTTQQEAERIAQLHPDFRE